MTLTRWIDVETERYLSRSEVADRCHLAKRLYEANGHLFEDERDALAALGTVPLADYQRLERRSPPPCPRPAASEACRRRGIVAGC